MDGRLLAQRVLHLSILSAHTSCEGIMLEDPLNFSMQVLCWQCAQAIAAAVGVCHGEEAWGACGGDIVSGTFNWQDA
jgi:hypothetical protein